ncbi:hypothetical protein MCHI_000684 [Candidatus Magnetoovum chiemensis]|nr:hypothetical protein MCHI_000684 [Candidatus Magnetoovum chiemensis]
MVNLTLKTDSLLNFLFLLFQVLSQHQCWRDLQILHLLIAHHNIENSQYKLRIPRNN